MESYTILSIFSIQIWHKFFLRIVCFLQNLHLVITKLLDKIFHPFKKKKMLKPRCLKFLIYFWNRGKSGVGRNLVAAQNFQWTSFTAKSGFQMITTEHVFSLKSGFKKIWSPLNMVSVLNLDSQKIWCTPVFPLFGQKLWIQTKTVSY